MNRMSSYELLRQRAEQQADTSSQSNTSQQKATTITNIAPQQIEEEIQVYGESFEEDEIPVEFNQPLSVTSSLTQHGSVEIEEDYGHDDFQADEAVSQAIQAARMRVLGDTENDTF
jgi:hypothetical protein